MTDLHPSPRRSSIPRALALAASVSMGWVVFASPGALAQQPEPPADSTEVERPGADADADAAADSGAVAPATEGLELEDQIPIDSANAIHEITPELRDELELFPEVRGFMGARLFRVTDGRAVLEISFQTDDGRRMRERRYLPPEVLESLRQHLQERIAERGMPGAVPATSDSSMVARAPTGARRDRADPPRDRADPDDDARRPDDPRPAEPDRGAGIRTPGADPADPAPAADAGPEPAAGAPSRGGAGGAVAPETEDTSGGRTRFLIGQTALGVGYGWAVPRILDLEDDREVAGAWALTTGMSFLVPYLITHGRSVGAEEARMAFWGGSRGMLYGILGGRMAFGVDDGTLRHDRIQYGAGLVTSVVGSYLGYKLVDWASLDEGRGAVWRTMADVGALAGFGTAYATGLHNEEVIRGGPGGEAPDEDDPDWYLWNGGGDASAAEEVRPEYPHYENLPVFGMGLVGLAAGRWLGRHHDYTAGDAYALRSMAGLGALVGLPISEMTLGETEDRAKRYALGATAGGILGTAGGAWLLAGRDISPDRGLLLNGGQLAGGLIGIGGAWLAESETEGNEVLYTAAAAAGSALGLGLVYWATGGDERSIAAGDGRPGVDGSGALSHRRPARPDGVQIRFSPVALVSSLASPIRAGPGLGDSGDARPPIPALVTLRF